MNGQRSGIPKVVGILMIIFASLGLLLGLLGLAGNTAGDAEELFAELPEWKTWKTMSLVFGIVGLGISALHLFAGISAVMYKARAPMLAIAYGVLNIATTIANAVVMFAWVKPALVAVSPKAGEMVGVGIVVGVIIWIAWPIVVLSLMTRPGARAACVH